MKHLQKKQIQGSLLILIAVGLFLSCNTKEEEKWVPLLDKGLSQWRTYQSYELADSFKVIPPLDEKGEPVSPVGYDKNEKNVFSVAEENGELVLRISGEIYGCLFTKEEFQNYHLRLKVKFGEQKWSPRLNKAMDSGILYHSQGECGVDGWKSWMLSQELQVMEGGTPEGNTGDYWPIATSQLKIRASVPEGETNYFYNPDAPLVSFGHGGIQSVCRAQDRTSPKGEWTTVELICYEGKSLHIVNGHVVMALKDSRYWNGTESLPLVKGKIQLQSEAAEVFYKEIEIKTIKQVPEEYFN